MSALKITLVVSVVVMAAFVEDSSANDDLKLSETKGRRHRQYAIYGRGGYGSQIQHGYGQVQHGYGQVQHGYGHVQPGYGHVQPGYGHVQHGYGQVQHGYGQVQPGYGQTNQAYSPRNRYVQLTGQGHVYGQRNIQAHQYGSNGYAGHILWYGDIQYRPTVQQYGYEKDYVHEENYEYQTGYESEDTKDYETKGGKSNAYVDQTKGYGSVEEEYHEPEREQSKVHYSYGKGRDSDEENDYEFKSGDNSKTNKGYKKTKSTKNDVKIKEKKYGSYINHIGSKGRDN